MQKISVHKNHENKGEKKKLNDFWFPKNLPAKNVYNTAFLEPQRSKGHSIWKQTHIGDWWES